MYRILLADDHQGFREVYHELLQMSGYEVIGVSDGKMVLEKLSAYQPHLVLCDYDLPGLNGLEVLKAVRANPLTKSLPFILITAIAERHVEEAARAADADAVLFKPVSVQDLLDHMQALLSQV